MQVGLAKRLALHNCAIAFLDAAIAFLDAVKDRKIDKDRLGFWQDEGSQKRGNTMRAFSEGKDETVGEGEMRYLPTNPSGFPLVVHIIYIGHVSSF